MKVKRNKKMYSKKREGQWLILREGKGYVEELNEVAGFIWELAEDEIKVEGIIEGVVCEYEVSKEEAERDIKEFINDFLDEGYLEKVKE